MVSNVRAALTRKFGPLPVWAWAFLAGGAIFLYRSMHGQYAANSAATGTDTSGSASDGSGSTAADPVTLSPGESVYNPATGQLVSTAPEQQPGADPGTPPDPSLPITLDPGQAVYDPTTGSFLTNAKAKVRTKVKRKPKPKPHHKPSHPKHPGHKGHGRPKPHGHGVTRHKTHTPKGSGKDAEPKGARTRDRKVPGLHPPKPKPQPVRHVVRTPHPAIRQRTAATHPKPHPASKAHPKATPPRHPHHHRRTR